MDIETTEQRHGDASKQQSAKNVRHSTQKGRVMPPNNNLPETLDIVPIKAGATANRKTKKHRYYGRVGWKKKKRWLGVLIPMARQHPGKRETRVD